MSTIEQDVYNIRNAIYGRDVRESIADAIEELQQYEIDDNTINTKIKNALENTNSYDYFTGLVNRRNQTHNGVTYTWNGTVCTVTGTPSSGSANVLFFPQNLPEDVVPGQYYYVGYETTNDNVFFRIIFSRSGGSDEAMYFKFGRWIRVPSDATGWTACIYVHSGSGSVTTTYVSKICFVKYLTNDMLTSMTKSLVSELDPNGKYVAFGDSLIWGSVWAKTEGTALHRAEDRYRIPTRIAIATRYYNNYENLGVGGIGYVTKINGENIVDKIKAYNLSNVGLITVMAGPNDYAENLGTAIDSVIGDETICGSIKEIISYVNNVNPRTQLVFIQSTPFGPTSDVWDYRSTGGWSINDFEREVSIVCKNYNVGYVSWHGCAYVSAWKTLNNNGWNGSTGPNHTHPVEDIDYAILGDYIAGKIAANLYADGSASLDLLKTDLYLNDSSITNNVVVGIMGKVNSVNDWMHGFYVNGNNGVIQKSDQTVVSCTRDLIAIPDDMIIHIHGAQKIFKYDKSGIYLSYITSSSLDNAISSEEAKYVRLQYLSVTPETLDFHVWYKYFARSEYGSIRSLDEKILMSAKDISNGYRRLSESIGNPLILTDCDSASPFDKFEIDGNINNEKIVVCKKNIFKLRHSGGEYRNNGVIFNFNTILNTIRVRSSEALAPIISGFSDFGNEFSKVNGTTFYHNFKFKFPVATQVSVSDNPSRVLLFDEKIQLRIYDGTKIYGCSAGGLTFVAEPNKEYIAYIFVGQGWKGDVTFSPQIEIGPAPTSYERFEGYQTTLSSIGEENIFRCGGLRPGRYRIRGNDVQFDALFDSISNEIYLDACVGTTGTSWNMVSVVDTAQGGTVNNINIPYIFKFVPGAGPVFFKAADDRYAGKIIGQITDGETGITDYLGNGRLFEAEANKEYAFRFYIADNTDISNAVIKPIISTGIYAIKNKGGYGNGTTIYTSGSTTLTILPKECATKNLAEENQKWINALQNFTGGRIMTPFTKIFSRPPMVSFIDDDTTSITFVQRYHDVFAAKNVLGSYAVETGNLEQQSGLPELLLNYEEEGFSCLYHCYQQSGDATRYWIEGHPDYDESRINENFMRGLRKMQEYGFSNYRQWVSPYGVNNKFVVDLCRNHGMECLLNCPSGTHTQESYVTPYGNVDRWNIPRCIFGNYNGNDEFLHRVIDNTYISHGWLIIVSHVNSWGSNVEDMGSRLSNLIQYCIDKGMEIVPFSVGFDMYRSVFMLNDMF